MSDYRAVLFDMDGVLIDTEPTWKDHWQNVVFDDTQDGEPTLEFVTGRSYPEGVREIEAEFGLEREPVYYNERFEERAETLYAEDAAGSTLVHETFDDIRDRGVAVGVVSSSPRDWIETMVDRFELEPLDVIVSGTELDGPGKPEPLIYETAAEQVGVDPEDCIVIEDSANGVRAGSSAGATVIRFAVSEDVEPMDEAYALAADSEELREILLGLLDGER